MKSTHASKHPFRIQAINAVALTLAALLAVAAVLVSVQISYENRRTETVHQQYELCTQAATELMETSDFLTTEARMYVTTGEPEFLDGYLEEVLHTKRRDKAVQTLGDSLGSGQAYMKLADALQESNTLAKQELYAMRLIADVNHMDPLPDALEDVQLSTEDDQLAIRPKQLRAKELVLGSGYRTIKERIISNVDECTSELIDGLRREEDQSERALELLLGYLRVISTLLLGIVGIITVANYTLVIRPMRTYDESISHDEPLQHQGSKELQQFVDSYNVMYEENHRRTLLLQHEAETDALTGLLNRGSYDKLLEHHGPDIALLLFDIDYFKEVNDTHGHNVGDEILRKVGHSLAEHFRTTDYACRIGGDEFAVIMTEMRGVGHHIITRKLDAIATWLADTSDGLPKVTLSVGIVLSAEAPDDTNLYEAADQALYEAKRRGRNRYTFFGDQ